MTWKGSGLSSWSSSSQVPKIKHSIPAHIVMIYPIWVKRNCCFIMKSVPLLTTVAGWMCRVRAWSWSWTKNSRRVFKTDGINNCNYTGPLLGSCTDGFYSRDSCLNTTSKCLQTPVAIFFSPCGIYHVLLTIGAKCLPHTLFRYL